MPVEIANATIERTSLGIEDHGILTAFLHLEGDGWGQGFGGFQHDYYDAQRKCRVGQPSLATFVRGVLDALGVDEWADLDGVSCRVRWDDGPRRGTISAIGHIVKDRWFDAKAAFAAQEA